MKPSWMDRSIVPENHCLLNFKIIVGVVFEIRIIYVSTRIASWKVLI